ncbi:MAG: hypothetical protein N3G21_11420 [Candidatus Hydrogenedentes bacterium]|nr:hypothetical protein [Candidatus Hydrogenedentota bacterium]
MNAQVIGGTGTKSYRWLRNGQEVMVTSTPSLVVNPVQLSNTGTYTVEVTDSTHTELSDNSASVTVYLPVNITTQPVGGNYITGQSLTISVSATGGKGILTYDWRKGGVSIGAPNLPYLDLSPAGPEDNGNYDVVITDELGTIPYGRVTSSQVQITVNDPLAIYGPASNTTVYVGVPNVQLNVLVSGGIVPYRFQWFKDLNNNGTLDQGEALSNTPPFSGVDTDTLVITSPTTNENGVYRCKVTDNGGNGTSLVSQPGTLAVVPHLSITVQPQDAVRNPGQSVQFTVEVSGGIPPISYTWRRASIGNLPPEQQPNSNILTITNLTEAHEDFYDVVIEDSGTDQLTSNAVFLMIVNNPLTIVSHPVGTRKYAGELNSYTMNVATSGGYGAINYLWLKNGQPAPGVNNQPNYTISPMTIGSSGIYTCKVWDAVPGNELESNPAEIVVANHMQITDDLDEVYYFLQTEPMILSVTVSGGLGELGYEWWRDGGNGFERIGTTPQLVFNNPTPYLDGRYYVVVRDEREEITSRISTVYVGLPLVAPFTLSDVLLYVDEAPNFTLGENVPVSGFGVKQYKWYKDGETAPGINNELVYTSPGLAPDLSGEYWLEIRDARDTVVTNKARVLIGEHIQITAQPVGGIAELGSTWRFEVEVDGGLGELHYQWKFQPLHSGKEVISIGDDSPVLEIVDISNEDAGTYWVEISDAKEVIESEHVLLNVEKGIPATGVVNILLLILILSIVTSIFLIRRHNNIVN